ncbi:hypothetical protein QFC22_002923 [Naganishia vaughanmartiniae]|uniref:Uncharacterized protein n=1 Tax=Naganishia vaughanmartiniae TaxID=1424756 RepID=A0ACC2XAC9_9TREE|nr:hypothetical protein QFC22_002923 [Naganishia vaughanmartiniae]
MQHTPRLNRPSLLSMQHNYESQDGDGDTEQAGCQGQRSSGVSMMRRVHSYSGPEVGVEDRAMMSERGSWDEGQGQGNGFTFTPSATIAGQDRRAVSALGQSFDASGTITDTTLPSRSISMHAIPSFGSRPTEPSGSASATGLLVGPSIPLALRRASSDQYPGAGDSGRGGEESDGKRKDRGFTGAAVQTGFSTGWTTSAVGSAKQPSTPPKGSATIASVAIGTMSFNTGSPSNNAQGGNMIMSTTPVRSSAGLGARARANSGTRLRSASGPFGISTRHPPLPPSLRATLAADKDLPSSEIRSEALLQRVIFSNPDSLPMTPKPSRRHQQQQQQFGQFGTATGGTGTPGGALFGGNMNMFSGNGYAGRTAARPPRFLDSAASTIDSDDEDEMEDSSDEEAQFAVDDIMDTVGASIGNGTGPASRSGSGSGSASGSVSLGLAGPGRALSIAGTEGGMEVDVLMSGGGNAAAGQGKLSNQTSMSSLRGFAGIDADDSGGSGQNKNMTAWRESPSSTSTRVQKRKAGHDDSRYEPYGKRHRGDGPLSPLQWTSALPGTSVPPIPISPSNQYTAHHNPHFPSQATGAPSGSASSAGTGTGSDSAVMQMDAGLGLALNKYGYPSVAVATARSRAGSPVANTYAAMRTAVSPVASSPLSMMSGMGIGGQSGGHPSAAYRPPSSSAAGAGGTTIGMNGMGGLGMLLLSKRHATNPGGTGMGLVSMGDDSGEMEVAEGIHGMDVTEHGAQSHTREDEDDKMMFD